MLIGASLSLTSWYGALILGAWRTLTASFLSIIIVYIIAVIFAALILKVIEKKMQIL
jgi:ABC-type amino acid transport system permease subunit